MIESMAKWAPLGLIICLGCVSLLVIGGQAVGSSPSIAQRSIQSTQSTIPSSVVVSLNTTEIFAFSSGKVTLNITSDGDGVLVVNLTNVEGAFPPSSTRIPFTNLNATYEVPFSPSWNALPSTYSLKVDAWYVNVSNGDSLDAVFSGAVQVRLGMGAVLGLPILLAIVVIAIVIVVKLRKPTSTEKAEANKDKSSAEGTASSSGVANKIRCPECKKLIDEGSVFCAECGARIPEFLRYNTPQA